MRTRWCGVCGDSADSPVEASKHEREKHNGRSVIWDEFKPGSLDALLRSAFRAGARYGRTNKEVKNAISLREVHEARAFHGWRSAMELPDADDAWPAPAMGDKSEENFARLLGTPRTPTT